MKHNKKDKLEHHLMEYKRKSDQIEHRHHIGEFANPSVRIRGILYCKECGDIIRYGRKKEEDV